MRKTYVLDTNVILHSPNALSSFQDNRVVVPISVIEELDTFKRGHDEKNRNARIFARQLDALRSKGSLSEGVETDQGGIVQVMLTSSVDLPPEMSLSVADNRILLCALQAKAEYGEAVFVSKDLNARIKADALGIPAEDYETGKVQNEGVYKGWRRFSADKLSLTDIEDDEHPLLANEFVIADTEDGEVLMARYHATAKALKRLKYGEKDPWGITALNPQQQAALDVLLDPAVDLVTLVGHAGTGKTLLALASALQCSLDDHNYRKILVSRPIIPLGRDIGFLPGTKDDKMQLWMQPIYDNLEYIMTEFLGQGDKVTEQIKHLFTTKKIELEAMTFIRGRSLPEQYMIVDEAQNLTPHEVKTIISRAGKGTKVVLTGDPQQIDHPYLDRSSNGLAYVVERFKGQLNYGHVELVESERSKLSAQAVELL